MSTVDEMIAAAKAEIETWKVVMTQQIRTEHAAQMQAILARARKDMQTGLDNALVAYRKSLQDIARMRAQARSQDPQLAERMEKVYARMEQSSKTAFESQVSFIKDMYKRGLNVS